MSHETGLAFIFAGGISWQLRLLDCKNNYARWSSACCGNQAPAFDTSDKSSKSPGLWKPEVVNSRKRSSRLTCYLKTLTLFTALICDCLAVQIVVQIEHVLWESADS